MHATDGKRTLPASQLDFSVAIAVRDSKRDDAVTDYAEHLADLPPVTVFRDPTSGKYRVADGRHTAAAFEAKYGPHADIPVDIREGDHEAALLYALKANTRHGIRESREDKRAKVRAALKQWPDVSDRDIADKCNVSPTTVGTVRKELAPVEVSNLDTCPQTRTGRDGKQYPSQVSQPRDNRGSIVRDIVPVKPPEPKRPPPFVDRWDEWFGKLIRQADDAARASGVMQSQPHKRCLQLLVDAAKAYKLMRPAVG